MALDGAPANSDGVFAIPAGGSSGGGPHIHLQRHTWPNATASTSELPCEQVQSDAEAPALLRMQYERSPHPDLLYKYTQQKKTALRSDMP